MLGPIGTNGSQTTLADTRLPQTIEANNDAPDKRRCEKCSLREDAVYGHRDLGQDTEQGIDPAALFPPSPRSEVDVTGNQGYPP